MAMNIMIQGTMSNAGKSLLAAGLCRVLKQDGYRVAPFKSQNMALNSFITAAGGDDPAYIRPPYGNANQTVRSNVSVPLINWAVDPLDWKYRNADTVCNNIVSGAYDGAIILVHDIHKTSVPGALAAIDELLDEGYEFVTVKDLFKRRGVTPEAGKVYYDAKNNGINLSAEQISPEYYDEDKLAAHWGYDALCLCMERGWLTTDAGGRWLPNHYVTRGALATAFGRPAWDISFHVNMDAASLIGMDTFVDGRVEFRPGPVYRCAQCGGFGVLDEINMAKNEALAVLHAVLDFRRAIDVPGYERIPLAEETRFIATMNYGYAGTRELNEALTSRFVVIQMPTITEENLEKLLRAQFPDLTGKYVHQFAQLFLDLQKKCDSAEISTKALDLRGMLDALRLIRRGVPAGAALDMGITNKAFDSYEQGLIRDVIAARIPAQLTAAKLFD